MAALLLAAVHRARVQASANALLDWESDHKETSLPGMTQAEFFDALFEIAEIWLVPRAVLLLSIHAHNFWFLRAGSTMHQ